VFVDNPSGLCPACLELEEGEEFKVVDFLRERGKASIEEIHNATGVKEKTILRMMKRGRFISDFTITYPCESCGTLISEGRLCSHCNKNIMDQVKQEEPKREEPKLAGRMYTTGFFKK